MEDGGAVEVTWWGRLFWPWKQRERELSQPGQVSAVEARAYAPEVWRGGDLEAGSVKGADAARFERARENAGERRELDEEAVCGQERRLSVDGPGDVCDAGTERVQVGVRVCERGTRVLVRVAGEGRTLVEGRRRRRRVDVQEETACKCF